ncbi:MAG: ABC transporter ATP-binding protein [Candidatus Aminicenantes bacterium]|nr:ABC transporter ATP-binding protein [Candidatus Aminicenantes bacterium]
MLSETIFLTWKKILRTNFIAVITCSTFVIYAFYLIFIADAPEEAARQSTLIFPLLSVLLSSGLIRDEFDQNQIYPFLSRFPARRLFMGKVLAVIIIIFSIYVLIGISAMITILAGHDFKATAQIFNCLLCGLILSFYFTSLGILLATQIKGAANFAAILLTEVLVIILAEKSFGFFKVLEARQANALTLKNITWLLLLPIRDQLVTWQLFILFAVSFAFIFLALVLFKHQSDKQNLKVVKVAQDANFLLKATGLKKTFHDGLLKRKTKEALKGVDFAIKPGKITGFLGPNGAGKSTTIKIILNFLRPEAGAVEFASSNNRKRHDKYPDIGYLQELSGLYPFLTPRETLYFVAKNKGMTKDEAGREVQNLAGKLSISDHLDRRLKNLSKGTMQKVALAVAILGQPDILIFDEPFTGLDPIIMNEIRNLILELKQAGKTIFLSSHLLSEVEKLCDEVILINEGHIVCAGEITRLKSAWQISELAKKNGQVAKRIREILNTEKLDLKFTSFLDSGEKLLKDETIAAHLAEAPVPDLEKIFLECVKESKATPVV